ncbi:37S ribosomal protein S23 mitochondrial [Rhizophlyctis rosea]|uniref:Small ribosomal subunit protein mS29 n=1 Tax=Rhizophlyctis rosea TaxID=64517 RepID=A0AAD5SA33_9FUNG|nr:37S ribosomal protein S23 mitochondrial [Rhizophlyctis rosea]
MLAKGALSAASRCRLASASAGTLRSHRTPVLAFSTTPVSHAAPTAKKKPSAGVPKIKRGGAPTDNDLDRAIDKAPPEPKPKYVPNKNAPEVVVGEWVPEKATEDNVPQVLSLPPSFVEAVPLDTLPTIMMKYFSEFKTPSLLARKITLKILDEVVAESKKPVADRVLMLDGRYGCGKSSVLLQSASYFKQSGWIVIYVPRTFDWVCGLEPYAPVKDTIYYDQPEATAKVLKAIGRLNGEALAEIPASSGKGTLADIVQQGSEDPAVAHACLEELFGELSNGGADRPPVLIAIDQVNGLYSRTAYRDVHSKVITADRFNLARSFIKFLNGERKLKGAVLTSTDYTTNHLHSPFLNHILTSPSTPTITIPTEESKLPGPMRRDFVPRRPLKDVDEFGVLSWGREGEVSFDNVLKRTKVHPRGVVRVEVPEFAKEELERVVGYWKAGGLVPLNRQRPGMIEKFYMMTGGNPYKLFRDLLTAL